MPAFQQQGLQWVLKSNRLFTTEMTNCRPCQQQFDFGGTVTISFHRRQNPTKKIYKIHTRIFLILLHSTCTRLKAEEFVCRGIMRLGTDWIESVLTDLFALWCVIGYIHQLLMIKPLQWVLRPVWLKKWVLELHSTVLLRRWWSAAETVSKLLIQKVRWLLLPL